MRSRYSAFALGLWEYLEQTQVAPFAAPQRTMKWVSLVVHGTNEKQVDFTATHIEGNRAVSLSECSTFERVDGRWKYVGGDAQVSETKLERNDPCPCGSGQKFKRCHA